MNRQALPAPYPRQPLGLATRTPRRGGSDLPSTGHSPATTLPHNSASGSYVLLPATKGLARVFQKAEGCEQGATEHPTGPLRGGLTVPKRPFG